LVGGVRLQGHTKVKYRDADGDRHTVKGHGNFGLRNFHGGVECNVGYRWVALSARYYPHSIFTKDGGPEVQQVNIGLSLMF
ncbi:MAG: PorT family protein, partial [Rikenella sp.]|nr:PorT family protein [Rikenella sp.]